MSCVTPLVEGCCESVIGFLCISPQTHFSSADFALYPFAVINLNCGYKKKKKKKTVKVMKRKERLRILNLNSEFSFMFH